MDEMNERREPSEQHEQPGMSEPADEWHGAPTERHLDQERPTPIERPVSQPYVPQQAYAPQQPYSEPYARERYGRGADPSLPLGREQRAERGNWRGGSEGERRRVSGWVPFLGGCLVAIAAVIALCAVSAGVLFSFAHNGATVTGTQTRNATVDGPATITLRVNAGNVQVVPGTTNQVTVVLNKEGRAFDHNRAQQALDAITLDVTQAANNVTISVHEPSFSAFDFFSRSTDLTITTPATTSLDATMAAGNLDVRGLTGALTVDLSAGNLTLHDMTISDHGTLQMQAGDLRASHVTGALTVTTNFGNVTLSQMTLTQNSTIRSDAGNISFDGSLRTGASLEVTDNAGNVTVNLPRQTDVHLNATTSAGKLTISGWPGISQSSSGAESSATGDLSAHPVGTLTLHVDAGNITLTGNEQ